MQGAIHSIGEAAKASGVKVPTIRYYEEIGLLPAPVRTEGGRRAFGEAEMRRLTFIRHARELGFEVENIRELLDMSGKPQASCHQADSIARNHLEEIDRRIASLTALRGELSRMVDECHHGRICDCRIIEVLADHSQCAADHLH
jgi:DNA-binding transcriptional MerR regulator